MVKTRIFVLSTAIFVACAAGSFWATYALDRIQEDPGPVTWATHAAGERENVETANGLPSSIPGAAGMRAARRLVEQMRAAFDPHGAGCDWSEKCALADEAVALGAAAVEPLGAVTRNASEPAGLRLFAVEILGRIAEPGAVTPILEALSPTAPEGLRIAALAALEAHEIGRERAGYIFFELARGDAQPNVRATATAILGRLGGAAAVRPLCVAARGDKSPTVRARAATALGVLLDEASLDTLRDVALLDRDPAVRTAAVEAAGNFREPKLREFFKGLQVRDESPLVQSAARRQLWRMPSD